MKGISFSVVDCCNEQMIDRSVRANSSWALSVNKIDPFSSSNEMVLEIGLNRRRIVVSWIDRLICVDPSTTASIGRTRVKRRERGDDGEEEEGDDEEDDVVIDGNGKEEEDVLIESDLELDRDLVLEF